MKKCWIAGVVIAAVISVVPLDWFASDALAKDGSRGGGSYKGGRSKGGDVSVGGHIRKDGTYVQPHMQTAPNSSKLDNFSTKGNVNPYTGKPGTQEPFGR